MELSRFFFLNNILVNILVASTLILIPCYAATMAPAQAGTDDQLALVSFKSAIFDDPLHALASWNDSTHYCNWTGVKCSSQGRVIVLDLDSCNLSGSIPSSLANLTFLHTLNLPNNRLHGHIPHELGSGLSNLQYLNLSSNSLQGAIPSNLSHLIKTLALSNNKLNGQIPTDIGSHLPNLAYLDLSGNNLIGSIPPSLGNLSSTLLLAIDLSNNTISGVIPSSIFQHLNSLESLSLNRNNLTGTIPSTLSSILHLDLSYNTLTGSLDLPNLSSLVTVDLTMNQLSGPISSSLGGQLHSLTSLYLTANSFSGHIPTSLASLPALRILALSHNQLTGTVPPALYNVSTLTHLGLADNQLVGTLPGDIGQTLPSLQYLLIYFNQFHGTLPMSLPNASGLQDIELTGNSFSGTIPSNLGSLKALFWLSLDRNDFSAHDTSSWSFLSSLTNCSELVSLGLDNNMLGGVLPNSVANLSAKLEWLALGGNQISGSLPSEIENLVGLTVLGLDRNLLSGIIPFTIGKLQNLRELFLWQNKFSGTIPSSISNLTQLNKLHIADNDLEGFIPPVLGDCQALRWLNLSYNKLTGSIPKEVVSISSLTEHLDLTHNLLTGPLPSEVTRLRNLVELYVTENNLSGEIPSSIGACQLLSILRMNGNQFQGVIPPTMANLKGIQELDLARNNLSGPIPKFLGDLSFLDYLNLSFNNFEGEVPRKGVFRNLTAVSLFGNSDLCGGDPKLDLPICSTGTNGRGDGSKRIKVIILVIIGSICSVFLICMLLVWYLLCRRRTKDAAVDFPKGQEDYQHMKRVSYSEILKATDELSPANLIGVGSFGSVYKGIMHFGEEKPVAVKVFNVQQHGASKSFMVECNALRSLRHRNLVKVLTLCSSVDHKGNEFKAIVFEYMSNNSLEKWLHPEGGEEHEGRSLSMQERLNIAMDVVYALEYLHFHGPVPVVHCDLKPSNVLLDDNKTAHVGDFGLAKLVTKTVGSSDSSIGMKGTVGYVAPEYGIGNKVSPLGDVYSYGVLLLEMFTGRRPTNEMFKDGLSLHKFVEMNFPDRVMGIVDPCLFQMEDEDLRLGTEVCLVSVVRIGLACSRQSPMNRMQLSDVLREMCTIRDSYAEAETQVEMNKENLIGDDSD